MAPVATAQRRYFIEFSGAMALYFVTLFGRRYGADAVASPILKDIIIASPILPVVLVSIAILRLFYRIDEYLRRQMLEALAIAGAFTCVFSLSWAFLVDIGLPNITIEWVWPIFAGFWVATTLIIRLRNMGGDDQAKAHLLRYGLQFLAVCIATAVYAVAASQIGWATDWHRLLLVFSIFFIIRFGYTLYTRKEPC